MMRADGIDRAIVEVAAPYWHCPQRYPLELTQMEKAIAEIRKAGFVVSHYDQYRDAFAKDPKASSYIQMNTELYPDRIVRQENGRLRDGWPPGFVINPRCAVELAAKQIPADLKRFPFNRYVSTWVRQVAFAEMTDHRFVSPDRQIQASVFSNGLGVVVNFGANGASTPRWANASGPELSDFRRGAKPRLSLAKRRFITRQSMADAICEFPLRIGLFGIGLDAYWPQFAGLQERLRVTYIRFNALDDRTGNDRRVAGPLRRLPRAGNRQRVSPRGFPSIR